MRFANRQYDTSSELVVLPYANGVKLARPDQLQKRKLTYSVADLLSLPVNVYFLQPDSTIMNMNNGVAAVLNFSSVNDAIGKSVRNSLVPCYARVIVDHDVRTFASRKPQISEDTGKRTDEVDLHCLSFKFPWYNSDNTLVGVFGFSIMQGDFTVATLADSLSLIMQTGLLGWPAAASLQPEQLFSGSSIEGVYLSRSETDILRLMVLGKTAKDIGRLTARSPRTVEHHIENIKNKTGCLTKSELIEKAVAHLLESIA